MNGVSCICVGMCGVISDCSVLCWRGVSVVVEVVVVRDKVERGGRGGEDICLL